MAGFSIRRSGSPLGGWSPRSTVPSPATGSGTPSTETSPAGRRSTTAIRRPCGKSRSMEIAPTTGNWRATCSSSSTRTWSVVMSSAAADSAAAMRGPSLLVTPVTSTDLTATRAESRSHR
jgi:hypothetical protein